MINAYSAIAAVVISAILALMIRRYRPEFAILISIAAAIMTLFFLLPCFAAVIEFLKVTARSLSGAEEKMRLLLKALGVAICAELGADLCRDSGESAMAGKVELCGKMTVLLLALPLATELLQMIEGLLR